MRNILRPRALIGAALLLAILSLGGPVPGQGRYLHGIIWPEPPVVTPGEGGAAAVRRRSCCSTARTSTPGRAPRAGRWTTTAASPSRAAIQTKKSFGDCQLHLEFASPKPAKGKGQGRGNNGIGLMGGRYEIQVLDSFENKTYPEGQCALGLQPAAADGQRLAQAGRVADLRHRLHRPALRRGRQGRRSRPT